MTAFLIAPLGVGAVLESALEGVVRDQVEPGRAFEECMLVLTSPTRLTRFGHFHEQTLALAVDAQSNAQTQALMRSDMPIVELEDELRTASPQLYERIELLTARFGWLNMEYCFGAPFRFEELLERVRWLARSNPQQKAHELADQRRHRQMRMAELLGSLRISPADITTAQLEQDYGYARHWRYEDLSLAGVHARALFDAVGARLELNYQDIAFLTPTECVEILATGQAADLDVLDLVHERRRGYAAEMLAGRIRVASGEELEDFPEAQQVTSDMREITGLVASPGFATGPVTVVRGKADFSKMKAGDVLVVTMTTPDYVSTMDKAAAIVADAGGRTSHTAIVSRELGIPCVIGTKFATQVLQDGEIVEVDAHHGRVMRVAEK